MEGRKKGRRKGDREDKWSEGGWKGVRGRERN